MPPPRDEQDRTDALVLLAQMRDGKDIDELSAALEAAAEAVRKTGRPATITYQLTVKPVSKDSTSAFTLASTLATKLPALPRDSMIVWTDKDGRIRDRNPKQDRLPGFTDERTTT